MQPPRLHLFQKNNLGLFGLNRSQPCARSPVLPPGKWSGWVAKLCRGLTPLQVLDQVFFYSYFANLRARAQNPSRDISSARAVGSSPASRSAVSISGAADFRLERSILRR